MLQRHRSLNRFAIAVALAASLVGARVGVDLFATPAVGFDPQPDLLLNQGQDVMVAFAAHGHPAGVTYTIQGLPADLGLSFSNGSDSLGPVGLLTGTLKTDVTLPNIENTYPVQILASDGSVSNSFNLDISHWGRGDVFVGSGEWIYKVYREDGTFKNDVTLPDTTPLGVTSVGSTAGCAVNWHTGEVWATNFDDVVPALNVITRHAGGGLSPFTDASRRLSTERYDAAGRTTQNSSLEQPWDQNPESVAFDNAGNMFVGHSFGYFNQDGNVSDATGVPTIIDGGYVDATGAPILDGDGNQLGDATPISPAGFFEQWLNGAPFPTNILGLDGNPIALRPQAGMDIHRYAPDSAGNYSQSRREFLDVRYGYTGVDTLDLLSDQKTINYTSENWYIYRYDVSASTQLPVVGSSVVGESVPASNRSLYGIRVLPPGDGSGGYLAVNSSHIERLDQNGRVIQYYDARDGLEDVNGWFAITIAPGGTKFWAATRQYLYLFDIASGAEVGDRIVVKALDETGTPKEVAGLCVMDEYRAAQEVCNVYDGTGQLISRDGNGVDDDHDGQVDEGCFSIEICSALSPGDDDGDGLVDFNDPDCGVPAAQQCVVGGPTDNSVPGICDRADFEGDNVVVPGVSLPCTDCSDWTFNYAATGLPPGLTMNPTTGEVTGLPYFSIVNPNSEASEDVTFNVTVNATWQRTGFQASSFNNAFKWTISNRNRLPVAADDGPVSLAAGASFTFDVRANDSDPDGDTISVQSFTQPPTGQGTVTQVGQNLIYTAPVSGFGGATSFTYKLQDSYETPGVSNDATVSLIVNGPPVAANDHYDARWNETLNVPFILGAMWNTAGRDADPEGSTITVVPSSVTAPSSGTVSMNDDGSFSYTPNTGFFGTDTFQYRVTDGVLESNLATVTIVVHRPPVGVDDFYTTPVNTPLVLAAPGIMSNDVDPEGGTLTVVIGSLAQLFHGTLTVLPNGSVTYIPDANYVGDDFFTYRVKNGLFESDNTTAHIKINGSPVANADNYTTAEDTPLVLPARGILMNDTDPNSDVLQVVVGTATSTSHGSVVLNPNGDGSLVYTPNANFNGTDAFTYQVTDGTAASNFTTVTITITAVDDAPVAVNDGATTAEDTPVSGSLKTNDTLSGDGGNTWSRVTNAASGNAVVNADGTFTYTPNANFNGTDSFTYQVCDGDADCSTATVTITVTSVDDAPVAVSDAFTTAEDTPVSGSLTGNDTPSGDGSNTWSVVTNAAKGNAVVNADGTFTYTPNANVNGTDSFTYKVCDADGDCSTATVTITITAVDDAPVAVNDAFTTAEDTPVSGSLTGNDTPSGDGSNTWSRVTNAATGNAVVNAAGTFTYTPSANVNGTDSFTYQICDGDGDCSIATVTITITPGDDAPAAVNDAYTTPVNTPVAGTAQINDTPSPDGGNVWSVVTGPTAAMGTLSFAPTGAFTFTPATGFTGTATFTYQVCDLDGDCAGATVTILIAAACEAGPFTTYTQGGWGAPPNGHNPAKLLQTNFAVVYPGGFVQIGTSARYLQFTTSTAIKNFLPAGGTPSTISSSATNPTSSPAGVFAGQVLALQLSVDFSEAGIKKRGLKNQVVASGELAGYTVGQVLALANSAIAGSALPSGLTLSELNAIVDAINNNYDNGTVDRHFLNDDPACAASSAAPVAVNDTYTTGENVAVTGSLAGNDTASTDGGNVWTVVNAPLHGTVTIAASGAFTYTPAANFSGADSFDYQVCDADEDCDSATATITVAPSDDAPVAVNDAYATPAAVAVSGNLAANDTASSDGGNVWTRVTNSVNGTATVNTNGTFTFTPANGFAGVTTFTYKVCDADIDCSTATVTITVTSVNHAPVAVSDAVSVDEGADETITVLTNDSDPDGDILSVIAYTAPARGTVVRTGNTFLYSAADDYSGTDPFTYTISDGRGGTATATVTITITGCTHGAFTTYTQGGWGANPSGGNPGQFLAANFTAVYGSGDVKVGGKKYLKFTSASAIAAFLPAGGTAAKLTANGTNPTSSTGGVFAGQVLALQLSVDFSKAGKTKAGLAALRVRTGKLAGYTVQQVLNLANAVLGGTTSSLPSGVSISDLNDIVDSINRNFDNGTTNNGYLG